MGMRDESWCNGCGAGVPYSEDEETYCGDCAEEYANAKYDKLVNEIIRLKNQTADELDEEEEFTEIHDVLTGTYETLDYLIDYIRENQ